MIVAIILDELLLVVKCQSNIELAKSKTQYRIRSNFLTGFAVTAVAKIIINTPIL